MTEDEAKKKWCPFARNAKAEDYGCQNRLAWGEPDKSCMCIGTACMAWRYQSDVEAYEGQTITDGYCGLAGKP